MARWRPSTTDRDRARSGDHAAGQGLVGVFGVRQGQRVWLSARVVDDAAFGPLAGIDDVNRHPVIHTWSYKLAEAA